MSEGRKITLLVVGIFLAVGLFYYLVFSGLSEKSEPIASHSFLQLNLSGSIEERSVEDPFAELFTGNIPSVENLLQAIRKAKFDEKIEGILIRPEGAVLGWGKAEEIRDALLDFKESGKPVYAYIEVAGNKDYFLASAADSIVGVSTGILYINGFLGGGTFLKGSLKKLGIQADFIAYGKYKSAPEMFTREKMSEPMREVVNSLLDDMYPRFVSTLAEARHLSKNKMKALIDRGFFSLTDARSEGLIDSLMFFNDLKSSLKSRYHRRLRFVSLKRYLKAPMPKIIGKAKSKLAVVYGVGTIVIGGEGQYGQNGLITSEGMANSIRKAADDKTVKAIILRVDSPGGSGTASEIIWREVVRARQKKPVIVSVSDLAASGGYYISLAADSIVAHPGSIMGSIGVFVGKFALSGLYHKLGITEDLVKRGQNADLFAQLRPFTPAQRKMMTKFIMDFYRDFVGKVATGRHMDYDAVDRIAQGRVWTGQQAVKNGLVDRLGDFHTAIQMAKKMAHIPLDEPVQLLIYPRKKTFVERLLSSALDAQTWVKLPRMEGLSFKIKSIVTALPYFRNGEPLFLTPVILTIK